MAGRIPLHFRRIEVKYLLPQSSVEPLLARLHPYVDLDPFLSTEGRGRVDYPVCSLYYDSADLHAYHEKMAGILARCKVRLRTYAQDFSSPAPLFLEVKRRWDLAIAKDRFLCPPLSVREDLRSLPTIIAALVRSRERDVELFRELTLLSSWYAYQPTAVVRYRRRPLVDRHDHRLRITLDTEIASTWKPSVLSGRTMVFHPCLPGRVVLELKSNTGIPSWFLEVIREFQLGRLSLSKYALAVQSHEAAVTLIP